MACFWKELQDVSERHEGVLLLLGAVFSLVLRCTIAVFPYSGEGRPPMHGDFEAQRHWMEITTALPVLQWYENSIDNDLLYWGLDYPPLTAYHSSFSVALATLFQLHESRGHESVRCRLFMRTSVILSDLLVYLPGALGAVRGLCAERETALARVASVVALWWLPPLLLVDHGHFQYNGTCFGLCLAAAGCVARGRTLVASVLFTSGLLFKQIALYYAPAFFVAILAVCLRRSHSVLAAIWDVGIHGSVVLCTGAALFAPWLASSTPTASAAQVLRRMFPFARGLYEDKVANVWCSVSVAVKLNKLLSPRHLPLLCAVVTLLALTPACACCLRFRQAGRGSFVAAMTASAFAFFLFAFQVHEKAILFPCVAACLLPIAMGPLKRPEWVAAALCHFLFVCLFSLYPLVVKDSLQVAYILVCAPLVALCEVLPALPVLRVAFRVSYIVVLSLHAIHALVPAPLRYPDIWTLLITSFSCAYFVLCLGALTTAQLLGEFETQEEPTKDD
eukprot:CAMPEP_0179174466 /NCGR_PEP_ID=MMETSP0796-20121207/86137_1 /TAXON_ID=73915 /ORGANISM="Pyrodinium bahamense, Strain pbaha01" /LENGTH=504 /DNA_ID=CAMNT_0020877763 /DNA_START=203 /DNA_END=1718 /DNA_ORIENTATION=-